MVEFKAGTKFFSFAEFDAAFETWKTTHFHPFRVASSETLRMPDGTANETFKYRYIVFHCAHYGAPRMRGAGKRPNQNYLPCGCRAMLRLNYSWSENALRITTLNTNHTGHSVSAESFARFAAKIRSRPFSSVSSSPSLSPHPPSLPSPSSSLASSEEMAPTVNLNNNEIGKISPQPQPEHQKENDAGLGVLKRTETITPLPSPLLHNIIDKRSDEERFAEMHATLQGLTDNLLWCRGAEFDGKLRQLKVVLKNWNLHK